MRSENCRRRLLTESDLTFTKAIEIARSMELARKDSTELKTGRVLLDRAEVSVNQISTLKKKSSHKSYCKSHKDEFVELEMRPAGRCGGKHNQKSCRLKDSKCYKCSAVGHIASKCNTRLKKAHHVDDGDVSDQNQMVNYMEFTQ